MARRHRARARRRRVARRLAGRAVAPPDAATPARRGSPSAVWPPMVGTELEFIVFSDTYEEAWTAGYRGLTPPTSTTSTTRSSARRRVEPLLRRIRNEMAGAGCTVESAKGECNLGQHEIVFRYDDALTTCDNHTVYKTGAKEIAAQDGCSLTFMAKVNEREGNSCHVHLSLRDGASQGSPVLAERRPAVAGRRALPRRPARDAARAHPVLRPQHQFVQALSGQARSRPPPSRGGSTTARARCGSWGTGPRCRSSTACPAATPTRTSRSQRSRGGLHGIEQSCRSQPPFRERLRSAPAASAVDAT